MKIACYFVGRSHFGGVERRIGRIMNRIATMGIDVTFVFTLYEPFETICEAYKAVIGEGYNIKMVGFSNGFDVLNYVRKTKFDCVFYAGSGKAMFPFLLGSCFARSYRVLLQVSTRPSVGIFKSKWSKLLFQIVAYLSNQIDCLYPSTVERFKSIFPNKIVTATPCPFTDLTRFSPQKKEKRIAFVSRWTPVKNVELFVESMLEIEHELFINKYQVLLCGESIDGEIEKDVDRILEKSKHPEIYIRPGYVKPEDILPQTEIFFSLQDINNYPSQSLLEALACGCYVIASDEGDTKLLVKEEFGKCCGFNTNEIAKATIEYIRFSQEQKENASLRARKFAEETFVIENSVEHYHRIICSNCIDRR